MCECNNIRLSFSVGAVGIQLLIGSRWRFSGLVVDAYLEGHSETSRRAKDSGASLDNNHAGRLETHFARRAR